MTKNIERVFRGRRLSDEEAARDKEIRMQVEAEHPPASRSIPASGRLSEALQEALRSSAKSTEQIARETGVSQIVVSQFLAGKRDIRMATADKLAEALGLGLGKHR
jgi:hypothetical protein